LVVEATAAIVSSFHGAWLRVSAARPKVYDLLAPPIRGDGSADLAAL
jgi:hypothetical protein